MTALRTENHIPEKAYFDREKVLEVVVSVAQSLRTFAPIATAHL